MSREFAEDYGLWRARLVKHDEVRGVRRGTSPERRSLFYLFHILGVCGQASEDPSPFLLNACLVLELALTIWKSVSIDEHILL